jgi:hypothetical protein
MWLYGFGVYKVFFALIQTLFLYIKINATSTFLQLLLKCPKLNENTYQVTDRIPIMFKTCKNQWHQTLEENQTTNCPGK